MDFNLYFSVFFDIITVGSQGEGSKRKSKYPVGLPAKNSSCDTHLYKLCERAGIPPFCMHTLRHTYATRAIESGMQPKILQKLSGHASIQTTMDTYVYVTDDSMSKAIQQFEASSKSAEVSP